MRYRFCLGNDNGFSIVEIDDTDFTVTYNNLIENGLTARFTVCKANVLYCLFRDNLGKFILKSYDKYLNESGSVDLGCIDARNMEIFGDNNCIMIPCGDSGFDLSVCIDSKGNVVDKLQRFLHTAENRKKYISCATCCKPTTNSYRIVSLDKCDGAITISNFYSAGETFVMRECSRVALGGEKGITDICFSGLDIAYVLAQNSNEIILVDFHSGSGSLWPLKSYSLPRFDDSEYLMLNYNDKLYVIDKIGYIYCFRINFDGSLHNHYKIAFNGFKASQVSFSEDYKYLAVMGNKNNQIKLYLCDEREFLTEII